MADNKKNPFSGIGVTPQGGPQREISPIVIAVERRGLGWDFWSGINAALILICLNSFFFLATKFSLGFTTAEGLRSELSAGGEYSRLLSQGEIWRIFTHTLLGDSGEKFILSLIGVALFSWLLDSLVGFVGVFAIYLAGAVASVGALVVFTPNAIGLSCWGALLAQILAGLTISIFSPKGNKNLIFTALAGLLVMLTALASDGITNPYSPFLAQLVGGATGVALGLLIVLFNARANSLFIVALSLGISGSVLWATIHTPKKINVLEISMEAKSELNAELARLTKLILNSSECISCNKAEHDFVQVITKARKKVSFALQDLSQAPEVQTKPLLDSLELIRQSRIYIKLLMTLEPPTKFSNLDLELIKQGGSPQDVLKSLESFKRDRLQASQGLLLEIKRQCEIPMIAEGIKSTCSSDNIKMIERKIDSLIEAQEVYLLVWLRSFLERSLTRGTGPGFEDEDLASALKINTAAIENNLAVLPIDLKEPDLKERFSSQIINETIGILRVYYKLRHALPELFSMSILAKSEKNSTYYKAWQIAKNELGEIKQNLLILPLDPRPTPHGIAIANLAEFIRVRELKLISLIDQLEPQKISLELAKKYPQNRYQISAGSAAEKISAAEMKESKALIDKFFSIRDRFKTSILCMANVDIHTDPPAGPQAKEKFVDLLGTQKFRFFFTPGNSCNMVPPNVFNQAKDFESETIRQRFNVLINGFCNALSMIYMGSLNRQVEDREIAFKKSAGNGYTVVSSAGINLGSLSQDLSELKLTYKMGQMSNIVIKFADDPGFGKQTMQSATLSGVGQQQISLRNIVLRKDGTPELLHGDYRTMNQGLEATITFDQCSGGAY